MRVGVVDIGVALGKRVLLYIIIRDTHLHGIHQVGQLHHEIFNPVQQLLIWLVLK